MAQGALAERAKLVRAWAPVCARGHQGAATPATAEAGRGAASARAGRQRRVDVRGGERRRRGEACAAQWCRANGGGPWGAVVEAVSAATSAAERARGRGDRGEQGRGRARGEGEREGARLTVAVGEWQWGAGRQTGTAALTEKTRAMESGEVEARRAPGGEDR